MGDKGSVIIADSGRGVEKGCFQILLDVADECSYDENGTRRQDIEIYYSFVGKIDLPEA